MIDGIDTKIQNVKDAFHRWSERRAMRKWDTPLEDALPAPAPLLPRRRQWQAFGFAAGVFVAALAAPGVGRVTRQEVGLSLFTGRVQTIKSLWTGAAVPMQAQRQSLNPALANDVEVQVAKVMFAPDQDAPDGDVGAAYSSGREAALQKRMLAQTLPALRVVMARFPADPLPRAAFLTRVCTFGSVNVIIDPWRDDTHVTPATPTPPAPIATPAGSASGTETKTAFKPETDMGSLKQCVQVAEEGERLEPDNAYFPVVLAHLHFAARDDQAALADIDRASRKPRWEDYDSALIRGACRLHDAQLGVSGSILHQTARDTALFLYGGFLYETARHLLLLAWKQEHAGNWEAGFALRGRMMRVGATIRDQARGRFVSGPGENMFLFACNFPRIEEGKYVPATISPQQVADYPQSLRHHHHAAEADWVQSQLKYFAATDVGALYQDNPASYDARSMPGYDEYDPGIMIRRVIWFWGAGVFALAQITLLLLTGGAAAWRNYRRRFSLNRPRPLSRPVAWGMGLALVMIACILIALTLGMAQGLSSAMDALPALSLLCLTLLVAGLMRGARDTALSALLTFGVACALIGTALVQLGGALLKTEELQGASSLYQILTQTLNGNNLRDAAGVTFTMTLCALVLPALFVLGVAVRSRMRRVPLSWGVWQGVSHALLPALSLLLIGYAGVGLATARAEVEAENALARLLDNENQATRDLYREARRNARERPALRALRVLTGDIYAANEAPPLNSARR